jgi:hypothetical protein
MAARSSFFQRTSFLALAFTALGGMSWSSPVLMQRLGDMVVGVAHAQQSAVLDNIVIKTPYVTYTFKKMEVDGSSLSAAEIKALFETPDLNGLSQKLATFSAKEIRIPELILDQKIGNTIQKTIYQNLVLKDVLNGKAALFTSLSGTFSTGEKDTTALSGTMGLMSAKDIDMALIARLYTDKAGVADKELKVVYGAFSADNLQFKGEKGENIAISRISGNDFKAKLGQTSWTDIMWQISGTDAENFDKLPPEKQKVLLNSLLDLFDSFDMGGLEILGMSVQNPSSKDQVNMKVARMSYGPLAGGSNDAREARLEGFDIIAKEGSAKIASISSTGFSLKPTWEALRNVAGKDTKNLTSAELRAFMPILGTLKMAGIDFDVPDTSAKKDKKEGSDSKVPNIKFSVKGVEITLDKPLNAIPTNIRYAVDGFNMAIPENTQEEGFKNLLAMGYKAITFSFGLGASWDEGKSEVGIKELAFNGEKMANSQSRLTLGNVTKEAFNADTAVATVALMGATAKAFDFSFENLGIVEKILEQEAKKVKKTGEDLRREYGAAAAVAIPAMLGNSDNARKIAQAVSRFIAKPGKLMISLKTKKPEGLGLADVMMDSSPAAILEKLEVNASAE